MKVIDTTYGLMIKRFGKIYFLNPETYVWQETPILSGKDIAKLNKKEKKEVKSEETK